MLEAERQRIIVKLVQEHSVIALQPLVETLGVSEATVRRDINDLALAGRLRRIRGGAEALTPRHETHLAGMPFHLSQSIGTAEKRAIGRAAAALVHDGESIIIGGGTSTYAMVDFLRERTLDVLTNSMPIVSKLLASGNHRITLPGGRIYREQNIVISPYENDSIEHFAAQRLFTGCFGISRHGLMETDPLLVRAMGKLLKRADQVIVLADSRKLKARSSMIAAPLSRVHTLITDVSAREEDLLPLREAGVKVITVEITDEDRSHEAVALKSGT